MTSDDADALATTAVGINDSDAVAIDDADALEATAVEIPAGRTASAMAATWDPNSDAATLELDTAIASAHDDFNASACISRGTIPRAAIEMTTPLAAYASTAMEIATNSDSYTTRMEARTASMKTATPNTIHTNNNIGTSAASNNEQRAEVAPKYTVVASE